MHPKKTLIGIVGIVGIWITAGIAVPLVNVLKEQSPEQLLAARGWVTALLTFIMLRGKVLGIDRFAIMMAITVPFASLGFFKGIREWGAAPTIIIIATTPAVNFLIAWVSKKKMSLAPVVCFGTMMIGIILARWNGAFSIKGLLWSLLGSIGSGIFYEFLTRSRSTSLQRCFWGSTGMGIMGLFGSLYAPWQALLHEPRMIGAVLLFAIIGGFLYWLANLLAFDNLPLQVASTLAQGETLSVILVAGILLDERLSAFQWSGVFIALVATGYLSHWTLKIKQNAT